MLAVSTLQSWRVTRLPVCPHLSSPTQKVQMGIQQAQAIHPTVGMSWGLAEMDKKRGWLAPVSWEELLLEFTTEPKLTDSVTDSSPCSCKGSGGGEAAEEGKEGGGRKYRTEI